ncbi:MAG: N-acetyltransferase [Pseudomonadota bacterium]
MPRDDVASTFIGEVTDKDRTFGIRLADTDEGRNSASLLISKMYATRGYNVAHMEKDPNRITLSASDKGIVIGTVTLGLDSPERGILADDVFGDRVNEYRANHARLCEITKLAFDPLVRSKMAMAALFHVLYIYAHYMHKRTDVLIEVNPRHRRFYETMLGFSEVAELRHNTRVDAPAHLMWLSVAYMGEQIARFGGHNSHPGDERSLYPYFFSQREEEGLAGRLIKLG